MRSLILLVLVGAATAGLAPLLRVAENAKGRYIIIFKDDLDVDSVAADIQRRTNQRRLGRANFSHRYYKVLKGVAVELSEAALEYIRSLDEVESVSEDGVGQATYIPWGLDRIDQRDSNRDNQFSTPAAYKEGEGVEIWVLDSGIRSTHKEFEGRVSIELDAYYGDGEDCHGHGTHCAGTAAGTLYGVAKKAKVKAIKVLGLLGCNKYGLFSAFIKGLDHVAENAQKPAVVSMSIGGPKFYWWEKAVRRVVEAGIPVVVSGGNDNGDACDACPAWMSEAITVGATTWEDKKASYSNHGSCIDIFAPGSSVESASFESDTGSTYKSGTSMACPHVAGIAALYLAENPNLTPSEIKQKLQDNATKDKLTDIQSGSPNLLAYV